MPYTKEYRAAVEAKLAQALPVTSKAMFGGVAFYAEGLIFALIDDDKLYFKGAETNIPDYEAAGCNVFVPYEGAKPMPYWELPAGIIDRPEELKVWMDKAIAAAVLLDSQKKTKKKK